MEVEEIWWAIVFLQIIAGWIFLRPRDRLPSKGSKPIRIRTASLRCSDVIRLESAWAMYPWCCASARVRVRQ